jgi:hypothetical protein
MIGALLKVIWSVWRPRKKVKKKKWYLYHFAAAKTKYNSLEPFCAALRYSKILKKDTHISRN